MKKTVPIGAHSAKEMKGGTGSPSVVGKSTTDRPLLRVKATRFLDWASLVVVKKSEILMEKKREAVPPIPIALTVLETVQ